MSTTYHPDVAADSREAEVEARPRWLTRLEFSLLAFVVASFAYELPLFNLTPYYKTQPRLFHVAAFLLIAYWLLAGQGRGWRLSLRNPAMRPWATITGIFVVVAILSAFFVPFAYWRFSAFYAARYVEGLVALLIVLSAPLDARAKRRLLWVALLGGTWVAFYALLQFFGIASTVQHLPSGEEIPTLESGVYSTLGTTYFHVGHFSVISGLVGLSLFRSSRGMPRVVAGLLAPFCVIPAVICGSRSAFFTVLIAMSLLVIQPEYRRYVSTYIMAALIGLVVNVFFSASVTRERLVETEGTENAAIHRLTQGPRTVLRGLHNHGAKYLLVGGGFYVVPLDGHYRVGYGTHNSWLFPLEQAGISGFLATIWLGITLYRHLRARKRRWRRGSLDQVFAGAMFVYFLSVAMGGITGGAFWLAVGRENLTFYQMLLFGLAMISTEEHESGERSRSEPPELDYGFARRSTGPAFLADSR